MKRYLAEFIGTFALVFIGCGSAVIAGSQIGFLGIALAFGLTVTAMAYAIGPISGCHLNPAITIGLTVAGRANSKDALPYIVAQCAGAIAGAAVLLVVAGGKPDYSISVNGLGQTGYAEHSPLGYSMASGFLVETILTFLFVTVVLGATHVKAEKSFAGAIIGFALVTFILAGLPVTGVSVNPARSLGPALLVGGDALAQLWLFIVAPILGASIAGALWRSLFESRSA